MNNTNSIGHITALFTIIIWGITYISTKVLLEAFQPVEILAIRFIIAFLALLIAYPHRLKFSTYKNELLFAAAGLCGICLYYLLENIALTYTMASNVGVIISIAPFFTALLTYFFMPKEEKLHLNFFIGFIVAMIGIGLISFNGSQLQLNPLGDLLAVIAAIVWACYSVLIKKISYLGYSTILTTRRIFFYGILFMLPILPLFNFNLNLASFKTPIYLGNLIFLSLGASAICFVTWNFAVKTLGAVKTSIYIYLVPVITIVTSALILHEEITPLALLGTLLTLAGLFLSETKSLFKGNKNREAFKPL